MEEAGPDVPTGRPAKAGGMGYIMGLDGLRALSVLVVLCYHAHLPWARGGYLGVEVFFVISGFLITRLLVLEHEEAGRISLGRFWFRRFKRLLPALWAILALLTLLGAALPWLKAAQFRGDLAASFLYVENWYQIASGGSYFSDQGLPLLRHIWSLAVEEQFYALWPLLVVVAFWAGRGRRRVLAALTFLLAAASAWALFHLADPDNASSVQALESMNRAYLGTDARACGILLGALLGMVRPPSGELRPWAKGAVQAWAFLALAGLLALCGLLDIQNRFLYRGGLLLVDGLTLSLVAVLVLAGPTLLRSILEWRVLTWIGKRSYGIYLWHWPVFRLLGPGETGWAWIAGRWALSFALAALSFALLETPIREGRLGRWLAQPGTWRRTARRLAFGTALAGGVAATTWAGVRIHQLPPYVDEIQESLKANARALDAGPGAKPAVPAETEPPPPPGPSRSGGPQPRHLAGVPPLDPGEVPEHVLDGLTVTAIGDSVMKGAALALQDLGEQVLGEDHITINAEESRAFSRAIGVIKGYQKANRLGDVVVIHLGTNNSSIPKGDFHQLAELLSDRKLVLFLTVKSDKAQACEEVNTQLANLVKGLPNAQLFDWRQISEEHPELFYSDQTHLRPNGAKLYASLIFTRIGKQIAKAPAPSR